uniref:Peroxin-19 n=1 Tax=Romanomermis culicivorax TaxID=13658 RepID=A0A915K675_ROMCU
MEKTPESAKSVPPPTFLESSDDENAGKSEDLEAAQNFLKNMQFLAEKAQKVQQASSEQELKQAMKDLNDDSTYESEFMPFMHGLMGSLLSKEMLYPPMKEMCEK